MSNWKREHDRIYSGNDTNRGSRIKKAREVIQWLRRQGLRPVLASQGDQIQLVAMGPGVDPKELLSERDIQLIIRLNEELVSLLQEERVDGHLGSRLLVFFEDVTFYDGAREESYHFPLGSVRVVESDLAERLVEFGGAEYYPGPKEGL